MCSSLRIFFASMLLSSAALAENVPPAIRRLVAIDNVCAWPALTKMPDGSLLATIYNQPSHGGKEGDVECWRSAEGDFWKRAGVPAPHESQTVRMNHAAGLARNGDVLVLCSAWSLGVQPGVAESRRSVLPLWVCRSSDQART